MPKAHPDFEDTAERFLDGELNAVQETQFFSRIKGDSHRREVLQEMIFARRAIQLYKKVLPPAIKFRRMRQRLLSELFI